MAGPARGYDGLTLGGRRRGKRYIKAVVGPEKKLAWFYDKNYVFAFVIRYS